MANEKTILKLNANGDLETIGIPLIEGQSYFFNESEINVPSIIKVPPYRNYFIHKNIVVGRLEVDGRLYGSTEYHRTSDYITVSKGEQVAFRVFYDNVTNARPFMTVNYYNENKEFVSAVFNGHILGAGVSTGVYTNTFTIPNNVAYLRACFNLYGNPSVEVKVSIEKASVPSQTHYLAIEDLNLPSWVKYTGNPISIFNEGIVVKGDLIIFSDNFNRPNSATLGDNWTVTQGNFAIVDNKLRGTVIGTTSIAVVDIGLYDNYAIELGTTVTYVSEGIIVRYVDNTNFIRLLVEQNDLILQSRVNGNTTIIGRVYNIMNSGTPHTLKVEMINGTIKLYVNDVMRINVEHNVHLNVSTKCGLSTWSHSNMFGYFDDFKVVKLH